MTIKYLVDHSLFGLPSSTRRPGIRAVVALPRAADEAFGHVVGHAVRQGSLEVERILSGHGKAVVQQPLGDAIAVVRIGADLGGKVSDGGIELVVCDHPV